MTADSSSDRDPVERLAEEFLDRRRRGEPATLEEYASRHPEWADRIAEMFPALLMMERLKPISGDRTGSFDGGPGDELEEESPERLGDYRIIREVGRGGMGVVYEAMQESLGRHVALKVLPLHGRIDPIQMERFRLEARSAARLHHTHIVPVYGVGQHGGVHYYAMQFIQGHGLDTILDDLRRLRPGGATLPPIAPDGRTDGADRGSLAVAQTLLKGEMATGQPVASGVPPASSDRSALTGRLGSSYHATIVRIGVQVAEALAHAHQQGILHRDIKPSNLLLDAEGAVWVTDFGLAKLEGSDGPTQTGDIVGTLRYMAPERFEGWSDPRSDVYGLGMTLYELLTLQPAFAAATRVALIDRVLHDVPVPPRKHDPRLPRDLETIVLKAIAKEPAERYTTARALADDLENFLAGKPIHARRVRLPERAWRWCRRNPTAAGLVGVSAIALLAIVGAGVAYGFQGKLKSLNGRLESSLRGERAARASEAKSHYFNDMLMAEREWNNNNARRSGDLLDEVAAKSGQADPPCGWEWHYLDRQRHTELKTLRIKAAQLQKVAFSPDGRRFISSDVEDKNGEGFKMWDAETGNQVHTIRGHSGNAFGATFSRDGTLIATSSGTYRNAGEVKIWAAATGAQLQSFSGATGGSSKVAFSPDGTRVAAVSGESRALGVLTVWDVHTGKQVFRKEQEPGEMGLIDLAFSPDGKYIATVSGKEGSVLTEDGTGAVKIRDSRTGDELLAWNGRQGPLIYVAYSPDGQRLATAGWDNTLKIWDSKTGKEIHTLRGHTQMPRTVVFNADGTRLASASEDNSAKVWDAATGEELFSLRGHTFALCWVTYIHDGRQLVTASMDGVLKFWDADAGKESLTLRASAPREPTGKGRDTGTGTDVRSLPERPAWVSSAMFSPNGREVATASIDKFVRVFDAASGKILRTFPEQSDVVWDVAYSPDGASIATAAGDWIHDETPGEVKLWDAATGAVLWTGHAHAGLVRALAFSPPDGARLATTGGEQTTEPGFIKVWDVKTGQEALPPLRGHTEGLNTVAYSPDGRLLASGGWDTTVRIWDANTGQTLWTLKGHSEAVFSVAFSPDGTRLASTSWDGTVRLWDVATGKAQFPFLGHKAGVLSVAFSPDGTRVASGGDDHTVKVWEASTGQEAITLRGHKDRVWRVAFSPDGHRLLSASGDGTVRIWDGSPSRYTARGAE